MFFDMFTKAEIKYEADEYKVFENKSIQSYDCKFIENKLYDFIEDIRESECKYGEALYNGLVKGYDIKEEMFIFKNTDNTQKNAFDRIEIEADLKEVYRNFNFIFHHLFSYREKVVFVEMILLKRSRDTMKEILNIGSDKVKQIKESVLIKIGIKFNWENIKK